MLSGRDVSNVEVTTSGREIPGLTILVLNARILSVLEPQKACDSKW